VSELVVVMAIIALEWLGRVSQLKYGVGICRAVEFTLSYKDS